MRSNYMFPKTSNRIRTKEISSPAWKGKKGAILREARPPVCTLTLSRHSTLGIDRASSELFAHGIRRCLIFNESKNFSQSASDRSWSLGLVVCRIQT